jgi:hypothetical protein
MIDSHPLLQADDILADCVKGKIWSKIDMTNSFFQTQMHPDDTFDSSDNPSWALGVDSHAHGFEEHALNPPMMHDECPLAIPGKNLPCLYK